MSINCENLIDLDLSSLGYFSVIPKDVRQLIERELLPDEILCKFVDKLYQEHTTMKSKYLRKDVIINDFLNLVHHYFGNPLNFEGLKQLIRDYALKFESIAYPSSSPIKDLEELILEYMKKETISSYNNTDNNNSDNNDNNDNNDDNNDELPWGSAQELIAIQWDIVEILNSDFTGYGTEERDMLEKIQYEIIYFILEEIFQTDPEMKQILLKFSHPLFVRIYSYLRGLSISELYEMTKFTKQFVDGPYERNIMENLYEEYNTLAIRYPKEKDFTDLMLNLKIWEEFRSILHFYDLFLSPDFYDGGFDYVAEREKQRLKHLMKSEKDKIKPILEKMVRMYYLNEVKKLHPKIYINPSFDFIYE